MLIKIFQRSCELRKGWLSDVTAFYRNHCKKVIFLFLIQKLGALKAHLNETVLLSICLNEMILWTPILQSTDTL